jgi:hypothetical protein
MEFTMPTIELPWNRKRTTIAGIEMPNVDKSVDRLKATLPKVDPAKVAEASVATVAAVVEDARRAIGAGAEQAAERAGQIGQEAGKISKTIATTGEQNLRSLGTDLRGLGRDVKTLRITRQKDQRPSMMPGIAILAGIGGGMAAMFFFDPEEGRRRRALLRDQLHKWVRQLRGAFGGRAADLRNRAGGLAHEVGSAGAGGVPGEGSIEPISVLGTAPDASSDLAMTDEAAGRGGNSDADTAIYSTSAIESPFEGEGYPETSSREVH